MADHISATNLFQMLVSGLALGSVYAVVGLGLTLVFGVMRVINMAHGEFVMVGAYITYWLFLWGISPVVALPVSMALLFLFGAAIHRLVVRRVVGSPELVSMLLTFGVSLAIVGLALAAWSSDYKSVPYLQEAITIGSARVAGAKVVAFLLALVLSIAFYLVLRFTRMGHAIRATSQVQEMAMICGINIAAVHLLTFGMGASLAAAGGSLLSMMYAIYPEMGLAFTIKAFALVILGGTGNFMGAFIAGLTLGVAETVGGLIFSVQAVEAIAFVLIILTLLVRPTGLFFGERE
jgi:branched-chain amino acid transport system permease protein